jgi:hypothetical protein
MKKYAPRRPDATLHRPGDIEYFRELVAASGLSQRQAAEAIGIGDRVMRYKLTPDDGSGRKVVPVTYAEQFALEVLADAAKR